MNYMLIFKGAELTEDEKRIELMQRVLFRAMVRESLSRMFRGLHNG